ncbi:MAG: AIPR family protein [Chloroflexi bacterium]|nr:AIPR family protein [Chloroflexota bacterium]
MPIFQLGLCDFLSLEPKLPSGSLNREAIEILKIVFDNLRKIQGGRPIIDIYYCTTGTYRAEKEIHASFDILKESVADLDLFSDVTVTPLGRPELLKMWAAVTEKNEARLKVIDYLGMPAMKGIPQSYIALVKAENFVKSLLTGDNGRLKLGIFDENIRSFLGSENPVNADIAETLKSESQRQLFSVLNNGITVVAPEITLTPNTKEIDIANYQIINGCQTSNTLWECKDLLTDNVNVVVKFIQSPDTDVSMSIISATNSQTGIKSESFHGLKI